MGDDLVMGDDWVTVTPAPGRIPETARELLALAASPAHVRTDSNGDEFRVPPYLAELYTTPPAAPKRRRTKKEEVTEDGD
jgi:hypothetical protein